MPHPTIPLDIRFWEKVSIPRDADDCWIWMAARDPNGYGRIGRGPRGTGTMLAHRYSFESTGGILQSGEEVCHICANPPCVNPQHLYAGTRSDNMKQAWRDGTGVVPNRWHGTKHHNPNKRCA